MLRRPLLPLLADGLYSLPIRPPARCSMAGLSPSTSEAKPVPPTPSRGGLLAAILMSLVALAIFVLAWAGAPPTTPWAQGYDPLGHWWLSAVCAALPVIVLLGTLAIFRMKALYSALLGLVTAIVIASGVFHMPIKMASITAV